MAGDTLDLAAMRAQAEAQVKAASAQAAESEPEKLIPREIQLNVTYPEPGTGKLLRYSLTSRVMTGVERRIASRMEVTIAGGISVASMSIPAQNRVRALAVCAVQLREPDKRFMEYLDEDDVLLMNVYGALEDHDRRYYFRDGGPCAKDAPPWGLAVVSPLGGPPQGDA